LILRAKTAVDFSLYLITDRNGTGGRPLEAVVEAALEGGVRAVQLREKDLSGGELYRLALALRRITARFRAQLFVNERVDIALAVDADGVHLGEAGLPVERARLLLGKKRLVGRSCHDLDGALAACRAGADFITYGPVFTTPSKAGMGDPVGLQRLAEAVRSVPLPVFALGGINRENVRATLATGAHGVAMISAIMADAEPSAAAADLLSLLPERRI
jgi:thiamine-phosphate pyrophosphorylase